MQKKIGNILKLFLKYWLPFVIWMIVIFTFSANPTVKTSEIHWQDFFFKKTAHIVEYFIFSALLYRALINSGIRSGKALIVVVAASFLYGFSDEYHQAFIPGRESRMRDVLIDTFGSLLFVFTLKKMILKNNHLLKFAKNINLLEKSLNKNSQMKRGRNCDKS